MGDEEVEELFEKDEENEEKKKRTNELEKAQE